MVICSVLYAPPRREVGQSFLTSVGTTLYALCFSLAAVLAFRPDLVRAPLI